MLNFQKFLLEIVQLEEEKKTNSPKMDINY